jgi:hypothetical protein
MLIPSDYRKQSNNNVTQVTHEGIIQYMSDYITNMRVGSQEGGRSRNSIVRTNEHANR